MLHVNYAYVICKLDVYAYVYTCVICKLWWYLVSNYLTWTIDERVPLI